MKLLVHFLVVATTILSVGTGDAAAFVSSTVVHVRRQQQQQQLTWTTATTTTSSTPRDVSQGVRTIHGDDDSNNVVESESTSRRSMLQNLSFASLGVGVVTTTATLWQTTSQVAWASGGATAGGAYLLSAKQRYNDRVTKGIKGFLVLGPSLESGDLTKTQEYFTCNDVGCWMDCSTAGYLLANAFRRSANTNPDSLPAVKAWKPFAKAVEGVEKSLKKKKAGVTLEAYNNAVALLDNYLDEVELPPSIELKK